MCLHRFGVVRPRRSPRFQPARGSAPLLYGALIGPTGTVPVGPCMPGSSSRQPDGAVLLAQLLGGKREPPDRRGCHRPVSGRGLGGHATRTYRPSDSSCSGIARRLGNIRPWPWRSWLRPVTASRKGGVRAPGRCACDAPATATSHADCSGRSPPAPSKAGPHGSAGRALPAPHPRFTVGTAAGYAAAVRCGRPITVCGKR